MSKNTRTRILLTAVATLLLVTMAVGGTLAWLQDETETITNKFTPSDISVEIEETGTTVDPDTQNETQEFQIIPGVNITKDPKVSAAADVPYYVFVKITEQNWNEFLTWDVDRDEWTVLQEKDENGIMIVYKDLAAGELTGTAVLEGNEIVVSSDMEKEDMPSAEPYPSLTFEAYAIQKQNSAEGNFTAAAAWAELNP